MPPKKKIKVEAIGEENAAAALATLRAENKDLQRRNELLQKQINDSESTSLDKSRAALLSSVMSSTIHSFTKPSFRYRKKIPLASETRSGRLAVDWHESKCYSSEYGRAHRRFAAALRGLGRSDNLFDFLSEGAPGRFRWGYHLASTRDADSILCEGFNPSMRGSNESGTSHECFHSSLNIAAAYTQYRKDVWCIVVAVIADDGPAKCSWLSSSDDEDTLLVANPQNFESSYCLPVGVLVQHGQTYKQKCGCAALKTTQLSFSSVSYLSDSDKWVRVAAGPARVILDAYDAGVPVVSYELTRGQWFVANLGNMKQQACVNKQPTGDEQRLKFH